MASRTTHRNNHFVPEFLLREWATAPDRKLTWFCFEAQRFLVGRTTPKHVGAEEHLYSTGGFEGQAHNTSFEKNYMGPVIDDPAARALRVILDDGVAELTDVQRADWARYLVTQFVRVPEMVASARSRGRDILIEDWPRKLVADYPGTTEDDWRAALEEHEGTRDLAIYSFPRIAESPALNKATLDLHWMVINLRWAYYDLLIGDSPLTVLRPFRDGAHIMMPISPRKLFVAIPNTDSVSDLSPDGFVKMSNRFQVQGATKYVYATTDRQVGFVRKWLPPSRSINTEHEAFGGRAV